MKPDILLTVLYTFLMELVRRICLNIKTLCGSRNYPYYPHGRSLEIPRGRGDLKAKVLEGQYEAKLEFPGGCGGAKQKTFHGGSMDIFWTYTLYSW